MKKILAFTLALAMVLATWTPTFAASKEVEALANLKLLLNTTDKEVNADLTRAVGLAMVLKALGYTQEDANAKAKDNTFVDMDKAAWAKGFAVLGEEMKITNGTSVEPKKFSPNWKLNERAFVAFMLRALGYDVDAAWAKAGEIAKEAGIAETVSENKLTKGEAAVIMYKALKAKVQGDEKGRTLAEKLVDEKKLDKELAVANGLLNAEPEMVEVVSAETDNLRQVTVKFNGSVDKDSAENVRNYRLSKTSRMFGKATLVDEKTVVLTLRETTSFENKKEVKLTVSGVKNLDKKVMKKQELAFTPIDTTYPTVEDIKVTGPQQLEITFSEPVQAPTNAKITLTGNKRVINTEAPVLHASKENVVVVKLRSALKDGTTYTVAVGNPKVNNSYVKDYANYPNVYVEKDVEYVLDKTAPEATVVKADQSVVVLEFTKPVTGLTLNHFYHTFTQYKAKGIYKKDDFSAADASIAKADAVSKVWIQFYDASKTTATEKGNPLPAGTTTVTVLTEADKTKIMDNWKNEFKTTSFNVEIVADREAPEVTNVEVTGEMMFKVTFNEAVKEVKTENFVVTNSSKEVKVTKVELDKAKKVATVTLKDSQAGKTLNLTVKGVKDASIYENMMSEYNDTLEFTDKTFAGPTTVEYRRYVKATGVTDMDDNHNYDKNTHAFELVVTYDENVAEAAANIKNYGYRIGNVVTSAVKEFSGDADFYGNFANVVTIPLTEEQAKEFTSDDEDLVVLETDVTKKPYLVINEKVTDLIGNTASAFDSVKEIKAYVASGATLSEVVAVANDKIEVTFSSALDSVDLGDFSIAGGYSFYNYEFDGSKKVTLYVNDEKLLPTATNGLNLVVKANADTKDIFGKPIAAGQKAVDDKIVAAVASLKYEEPAGDDTYAQLITGVTKVADNDGKAAVAVKFEANKKKAIVTIKYTEGIDKDSISTTTYKLNDGYKFLGFLAEDGNVDTQVLNSPHTTNDGTVEFVVEVTKDTQGTDVAEVDFKDLTVTQVGAVKDLVGNVTVGNSNALSVIVSK